MLHGESAINIHIGRDESGNYVPLAEGKYDATITVSTVDRFSNTVSGEDDVDFTVSERSYSYIFWKWVLIILAAIILLLILLGFPTKPKIVYISIGNNSFTFFPKRNSRLTVKYSRAAQDYIFKADCKTHWRWFRNSWLKNVFKRGDMSFKLKLENKAASVTNLTIEADPVVEGYIGWQDGNKQPSANVFTNRKD
ncbi:MAG: hypothetical protein IKZ05_06610 [Clostridia bacterium]|nr:hypothetical protein [Clostridia bacterium]